MLTFKKEAAANEAGVDALQSEYDDNMSQVLPTQTPLDPKERTFAYVEQVSQLSNQVVEIPVLTKLDPMAVPFEPKYKPSATLAVARYPERAEGHSAHKRCSGCFPR